MNKAAIRHHYGNPDVITIQNIPIPKPQKDEVVVKVHHTTVNRTDCGILWGKPFLIRFFTGLLKPRSLHPGSDFVGHIVAIGSGVNNFKEGDRVFGFNDNGNGTQAQYIRWNVKKHAIAIIPEQTDDLTALCALEGAHYAVNFLRKVDLKAEQKVMVNGGTGAIGSAAIQLLKARGIYVVATSPTAYVENVKALGADRVIDFLKEDFTLDKERYAFVFDAVGKSEFKKAKAILENEGVYISSELGPKGENPMLALLSHFHKGKKVRFPFPVDIPHTIQIVSKLLEDRKYSALIDKHFALDDIREAYHYVNSGKKIGNVIIDMDSGQ